MSNYAKDRAAFLTSQASQAAEIEAEKARREAMLAEWGITDTVTVKPQKVSRAAVLADSATAKESARDWQKAKKKKKKQAPPKAPKAAPKVRLNVSKTGKDGKKLTAAQRMAMLTGKAPKPAPRRTSTTVLAAAAASAQRRSSQS